MTNNTPWPLSNCIRHTIPSADDFSSKCEKICWDFLSFPSTSWTGSNVQWESEPVLKGKLKGKSNWANASGSTPPACTTSYYWKIPHYVWEELTMLLTDGICYQCPLPILTARPLTQKKRLHFPSSGKTLFFSSSSSSPPQVLCIFSIYKMLWDHSGRKAPCSITTLACEANTEKNGLLVINKLSANLSYAIYALDLIQDCKMWWFVLYWWALLPGIPSQYRCL